MVLTESLLAVNFIFAIIAIAVALILLPKLHSGLVAGWRLMILSLGVFALIQVMVATNASLETITVFNTIFIAIFMTGLLTHLIKLIEHSQGERRRRRRY